MRALVYEGPKKLVLREIDDPVPAEQEVLIRVLAAGICGTDRHLFAGELGVSQGTVPGHETAGQIVELGPGVEGWSVGDRVVLYGQKVCQKCDACLTGHRNRCARPEGFGIARQGGFAELIAAPASCLIRLPDAVTDGIGAIATDAIATPFHALVHSGRVRAGETVVIIGTGGLGLHAVLLARMMGAGHIVGADPSATARQSASAVGADEVFDPSAFDDPGRALRKLTGGATLALEFVGRGASVELGIEALSPGGRLVVVGVGHDRPRLPQITRFIGMELEVRGSFGSLPSDIEAVLGLISSGRLDVSHSISQSIPLERGAEVFGESAAPGRLVLEPANV